MWVSRNSPRLEKIFVDRFAFDFFKGSKWSLAKICYMISRYGNLLVIAAGLPCESDPRSQHHSCRAK